MAKYILQRVFYSLFLLALISFVVFIIIQLPPGDYADRYAYKLQQDGEFLRQEDIAQIREDLGLNRPIWEQYWSWITKIVLHGNFGMSFGWRMPVLEVIGDRVGMTAILAGVTLVFTYGLAIPIGIYSAVHQYSIPDYIFTFVGYIGLSMPNFLLALILLILSITMFDTTVAGLFSPEYRDAPWSWARLIDLLKHIWVPAVVLASSGTASTIRTLRATLLDEKGKLYVTAARAKGLPETRLLLKYPVRMALNPIISTLGWALNGVIAGAPIVGLVLALPDTGPLFLEALRDQDMYLGGAILLMYCVLTIIGTLISDVLLALLDPRIRYRA